MENFEVECDVCGQRYNNHVGSTECCGSIAYMVENGEKTKKFSLFASINNQEIKPIIINSKNK